ncbi:GNAT family N-acyltransferase [Rhodococcus sp. IEGM 1379]|uniref:GNAT family N-acetyltransferase n=1 Tax=Rhodococcus sp. IEGM 1379 TaxID=3047086 RepID=UPI0024B79515|nr:GNAT family N-acyltransferase [Rhodococcus sp. IEGM 1379]MDI9917759.1 GNAT family N-acyltransferase [Rhodococcus sp. IEGM 1379]
MTITSVLRPASDNLGREVAAPRYSLIVSSDREHRVAAQRLRYRVFAAEPGFSIPVSPFELDVDAFDEFCDHLLVRDNITDAYVGCYRMLTPDAAIKAGGYYTATEFDISALDPVGNRVVEMGRACVDPAHRNGSVLGIMWSGILQYLELTGHEWVMGCVSVPIAPHPGAVPGADVRAVRDYVMSKHPGPLDQRAVPRNPVVLGGRTLEEIAAPERLTMPPLLRGYLRMGAVICGEPAYDPAFGVADFVALQGLRTANTRYLERLRSAAAAQEGSAATEGRAG